jgi:hypothetical protein
MRLAVLVSVCLSLTMTWLCAKDREVSDSRHLPPLRLAATDLDAILLKTHSLIAAANGPSDLHHARERTRTPKDSPIVTNALQKFRTRI